MLGTITITPTCACGRHAEQASIRSVLTAIARRTFRTLATWRARSRQRSDLRYLDDRLLEDIGITRAQARKEAGKFFWR
jgi:uncharacterized protein YjiS (DUF1127 family)